MARYEHIGLFKTAYDLCVRTYKLTANFCREHKYTLGEKIKQTSHDIIDLIIEANSSPNTEKRQVLEKIKIKVEKLRIYFRVAGDLKILGVKSFGEASEKMEEIEKQIYGWEKWLAAKLER